MRSVLDPGILGRTSTAYAVPSDGDRVPLTRTEPTTAVEVFQYESQLWGYNNGKLTSKFDGAPLAWVP